MSSIDEDIINFEKLVESQIGKLRIVKLKLEGYQYCYKNIAAEEDIKILNTIPPIKHFISNYSSTIEQMTNHIKTMEYYVETNKRRLQYIYDIRRKYILMNYFTCFFYFLCILGTLINEIPIFLNYNLEYKVFTLVIFMIFIKLFTLDKRKKKLTVATRKISLIEKWKIDLEKFILDE